METKFKIGEQFKTRGKSPRICTIVDIYKTFNSAGKLVRLRYVATHDFAGQVVTDYDVPETAVAMGKID